MKYIDIFEQSQALLKGHFLLTSGLHSNTYFQCAKALQYPSNLTLLCKPIADHFSENNIDIVISPALGGIVVGTEVGRLLNVKTIFAERTNGIMTLRRGFTIERNTRILVIEDVVTTGGSVKEVMKIVEKNNAIVSGIGFIVDRSNDTVLLSPNQFSLIKIEASTYPENECPMCKTGSTPIKPGSRQNQ